MELPSCEATMLEIVPALPSWQSTHESGWPRLTLLNRLKKSARNWRLSCSLRLTDFDTDKSVLMYPGPRNESRPMLPKVPTSGRANAPKVEFACPGGCST